MTLNQLEQDCYRRLGFNTGTPDTATQTRIRSYLNETQQEILSEPGMESLLYDTMTFASVASTPEYSVLPASMARIRHVYDTTNLIPLRPESLAWYRAMYPSATASTGLPDVYVDLGTWAVSAQPSNASELFVISTSASDGAATTAYLEGYRTGGYFASVSKAMNGVTGVSFGATLTDWVEITKFYVTVAAVGTITLREDSGAGTALSTIPIGSLYARYRRLALAICPASAVTYTVDYERDVSDMAVATDEPVLPVRFHRMLATGARMKEYEKQDQPRFTMAARDFARDLTKLKAFVYGQATGQPNLRGQSVGSRGSRLGAWYGRDRW